jgi:3-methyladenine DNA glycosylase AlkD
MDYEDLFYALEMNADKDAAVKMSAYMREQFPFLGVKTPARKRLCRAFFIEAGKTAGIDWQFIDEAWAKPEREYQYIAVDYLNIVKDKLTPEDIPKLKRLAVTKSWWDTIDGLDRIIGHIAFRFTEVNDVLLAWSADDNFWLRRIAIDHQLQRKEQTDTGLLQKIIANNFGQKEFFVNKAIGWSLREYSKTNPDWVRDFIARHQEQLAPLSVREASKYI